MNSHLDMAISLKNHMDTVIQEVENYSTLLIKLYPNIHDDSFSGSSSNYTNEVKLVRRDRDLYQQKQKIKMAFDGLDFEQTKMIHAIMIIGKSHEEIGEGPNIAIKKTFNTVMALDKEQSVEMMVSKIGNLHNDLGKYLKNGMSLLHF
ncbi:hypothetical protein QCD85_10015 [Paenibacillus sp. PsM32]|uniref:hypothetical protein n=1 Tax=unclassified Paenibacillus TaxID=185978 RepID=UPI002366C516|nr:MULTISPECIES: hypothetical protein [unclassified Paenibacillus]MDN4618432.1 hypothetical protein [Paenibacillus sp. PsM32]WDF52931.1 hypothetical protein PQ460_11100 [Paenibacillus sp. KACC 21273]